MRTEVFLKNKEEILGLADCRDVSANLLGLETQNPRGYFGERRVSVLCPHHSDEHFGSCFATKEAIHCFACGWHADVFGLVQEVRACSFVEAEKILADYYGLSLDFNYKGSENDKKEEFLIIDGANLTMIGINDTAMLKKLYEESKEDFWKFLKTCIVDTKRNLMCLESGQFPPEVMAELLADRSALDSFYDRLKKTKERIGDGAKLVIVNQK